MRGNRSELAAARKSPWCHVNTPLEPIPDRGIIVKYLSPWPGKLILGWGWRAGLKITKMIPKQEKDLSYLTYIPIIVYSQRCS